MTVSAAAAGANAPAAPSTESPAVSSPITVAIPVAATAGGADTLGGPAATHRAAGARNEIPIRLTLGGSTLSIGTAGQWELEHASLRQYAERTRVLQERNAVLEKENAQLRDKCLRMTEESNMEKFKCQLLVEMLALSSLDEEKSKGEAEQERAKAASMQSDMLALLDQARREGLDVRKLASVLTSPQNSSSSASRP